MLTDRKITVFSKKVADLPDRPGGTMTTAQLKAQFDSSPEETRVAINGVVDDLVSTTPGSSGAEQIGSAPITGVTGTTVYSQIADVRAQFGNVILGQIPDSTITQQKMVPDLQAKLNQIVPLEREVANLKANSTVANRVDGASGIFYDLMDGANGGSIGKIDLFKTNVVGTILAGATSCTVANAAGLTVGMEVTFQDIVLETLRERKVITAIVGNVLSFSALANNYNASALVYRSLANVNLGNHTLSFAKAIQATVENLTKVANPSSMPGSTVNDISFSSDGSYMALATSTTPFILIYKISGNTFTKLPDPGTLPIASANGISFSPDNNYLAVGTNASTITIYKRTGDTFNKLSDPATMPAGTVNSSAWSADNTYLAVGHTTTPWVTIYKRTGDTFTKLADPATLPGASVNGLSFSSDGTYLATAGGSVYKRSGDTFTRLATSIGGTLSVSFSPDTNYLAVTTGTTPYILIYKRTGDTFTKLADPGTIPTAQANECRFTSDNTYLAVLTTATPYLIVYKRSGDTFTKQSDPSPLPDMTNMSALGISSDSSFLTLGGAASPFLDIYSGGTGIDVTQADIRYNISPASSIKNVVAWVDRDIDANFDVSGSLSVHSATESFAAMTESNAPLSGTTQEDQFTGNVTTANIKATLKFTANRNSTAVNKNITQITGAVGT